MRLIANQISRIKSHAHPTNEILTNEILTNFKNEILTRHTNEILTNMQISYKHSWLYLFCYNHECL